MENNKRKRLNKKKLLIFILLIYIVGVSFYYAYKMPIKNIVILGNKNINDAEVLEYLKVNDKTKFITLTKNTIEKRLKNNPKINNVKISKNYLTASITINIEEANILFYNVLTEKYVLDNGKEIDDKKYNGIPTLVNYVPSDAYEELIKKMKKVNPNILYHISEIEYVSEEVDDKFLFLMNDGNYVYINLINFENMINYEIIYTYLNDSEKGILNFDSVADFNNNELKVLFQSFKMLKEEQSKVQEDELLQ